MANCPSQPWCSSHRSLVFTQPILSIPLLMAGPRWCCAGGVRAEGRVCSQKSKWCSHIVMAIISCLLRTSRVFFGAWDSAVPCTWSLRVGLFHPPIICEFSSAEDPGHSKTPSPSYTLGHTKERCLHFIKSGDGRVSAS